MGEMLICNNRNNLHVPCFYEAFSHFLLTNFNPTTECGYLYVPFILDGRINQRKYWLKPRKRRVIWLKSSGQKHFLPCQWTKCKSIIFVITEENSNNTIHVLIFYLKNTYVIAILSGTFGITKIVRARFINSRWWDPTVSLLVTCGKLKKVYSKSFTSHSNLYIVIYTDINMYAE